MNLNLIIGVLIVKTSLIQYFLTAYLFPDVYQYAGYQYSQEKSKFCDHIYTYATDYIIGIFMIYWSFKFNECMKISKEKQLHELARNFRLYTIFLTVSVFIGGLSHQFLSSFEYRNQLVFRLFWTICVGSVAWCGGIVLDIARLISQIKQLKLQPTLSHNHSNFWGMFFFLQVALGLYSLQSPAADIFLAAIAQGIPTIYTSLIIVLAFNNSSKENQNLSYMTVFSFLFPMPLIFIYPLMEKSQIQLQYINTFLHSWLFIAWNMQANNLLRIFNHLNKNKNK